MSSRVPCERQVRTRAVADHQRGARRCRGVDHRLAFGERDGHRLLDERVLAARCGGDDVLRMQLVRRGDVHRVDVSVFAHRLDRRVRAPAELALELTARFLARIRLRRRARCADARRRSAA
jgi:hypothetical protein